MQSQAQHGQAGYVGISNQYLDYIIWLSGLWVAEGSSRALWWPEQLHLHNFFTVNVSSLSCNYVSTFLCRYRFLTQLKYTDVFNKRTAAVLWVNVPDRSVRFVPVRKDPRGKFCQEIFCLAAVIDWASPTSLRQVGPVLVWVCRDPRYWERGKGILCQLGELRWGKRLAATALCILTRYNNKTCSKSSVFFVGFVGWFCF